MLTRKLTRREVTLEEFTELMMGKLSGRAPQESLREVFVVLSGSKDSDESSLITLPQLKHVCEELKVRVLACVWKSGGCFCLDFAAAAARSFGITVQNFWHLNLSPSRPLFV